jgi:hypothetical protein
MKAQQPYYITGQSQAIMILKLTNNFYPSCKRYRDRYLNDSIVKITL